MDLGFLPGGGRENATRPAIRSACRWDRPRDAVDWVGAVFAAYGAELVDEKGNITVKSDATRQVLEWFKKLVPNLPPDVFAWDDASQQQGADLGQVGADHEPALGLGRREARRAEGRASNLWTFGPPKGPKGRMMPFLPYYWTIWKFSSNKPAAKSAADLSTAGEAGRAAGRGEPGYDIPPYRKLNDFEIWVESRAARRARSTAIRRATSDEITSIAMAPAPPNIAVQMYTQATMHEDDRAVHAEGKTIDQAMAWAADEIEGFMRG